MRQRLEGINEKIYDFSLYIVMIFCLSFLFVLYALQAISTGMGWYLPVLFGLILGISLVFFLRYIYKLFQKRNDTLLGLEAELAVGQELNQLMLHGYRVYHDFSFDEYNIDHIVVGPNGVFAIETKGKAKPDTGGGSKDATIIYNGKVLEFPDGFQTGEPLAQAKRQASSLSKWLSSAIGETITVKPALAYPGWFIKQTTPDVFLFLYGKAQHYQRALRMNEKINPATIQRIEHQLEQKCRNVKPIAYHQRKKWT
ncbi:MAG: nuclease-related domain-containing protein [Nitrospirota bacterium]